MAAPAIDLSRARILVTNDDGIDAPGIAILEKAARKLSSDVWVVAPETEQSAVAHGLTIRRPLRIRRVAERYLRK
ncbi:MAG: 5'/3'-nucleotidase SurE, partial [Alphaproteobacteria bacterium]